MELVSRCVSTTTDTPDGAGRLFSVPATPPLSVSSGYRPPGTASHQNRIQKSQSHVSISVLAGKICAEVVCSHSYQLKIKEEMIPYSRRPQKNRKTSFNRILILFLKFSQVI